MKTLYLVRHAHAGWNNANMGDFERTLSGQGRREASAMASRLLGRGFPPGAVVSSAAIRALETAEIFGSVLGFRIETVREEPAIYSGDVETLAGIVASLPEEAGAAMLFGHNPTISLYGSWLAGKPFAEMDTCGVLRLDLPAATWSAVAGGSAATASYLSPGRRQ